MTILTDVLAKAMAGLDQDKLNQLVKERLENGGKPMEIVEKLQEGMTEVGRLFENGEYYLSELIMAGEMMKETMAVLEPFLAGEKTEYRGTIVIATVKDDIHDLGKDIVVMLLRGAGYNVIDLGVDVPSDRIVEAVKENKAPMLALSVLLTGCLDSMKDTVRAVKDSGLAARVLIGGAIVDEKVKEYCGADYASMFASDAVKVAEEIFGKAN